MSGKGAPPPPAKGKGKGPAPPAAGGKGKGPAPAKGKGKAGGMPVDLMAQIQKKRIEGDASAKTDSPKNAKAPPAKSKGKGKGPAVGGNPMGDMFAEMAAKREAMAAKRAAGGDSDSPSPRARAKPAAAMNPMEAMMAEMAAKREAMAAKRAASSNGDAQMQDASPSGSKRVLSPPGDNSPGKNRRVRILFYIFDFSFLR